MKEKKAYVFFNCDEEKSQKSMNVFYNHTVYNDTKKARKALADKIEEELAAGRIQIEAGSLDKVKEEILEGKPEDASSLIQFGAVVCFDSI